jgi:ATP-dependent RNA helicase DDX24/MAK5
MVPEPKKRKAPTNSSSLINSRKRQKLQKTKAKAAGLTPTKPPPKTAPLPKAQSTSDLPPRPLKKETRITHIDDLKWHDVSVPDQLDDYEGFFGLEEVDDVEVVREKDGSKVSFRVLGEKNGEEEEVEIETEETQVEDTYYMVKKALKKTGNGVEILEDAWEGFSDAEAGEQEEGGAHTIELVEEESQEMNGATSKSALKKSKKDKKTAIGKPIGAIPFAGILDEENMDSGVDTKEWQPLQLLPETLSALSNMRFERPTPIQSAAIPDILAGHDVVGKASTGSGKTLAFGIPILERYLQSPRSDVPSDGQDITPLALILAPTRELAHQIGKHLTALCNQETFSGPRIATITGGLSIQKQQRQLTTADIIIGTPGRLWEVMGGGRGIITKLRKIQFLVVDEADRLLSDGHFKEVEEILNALDRVEEGDEDEGEKEERVERQTLVFSATFHKGLQQKLAGKSRPSGGPMTMQESMEYLLKKLKFREEKPKFVDVNPDSQMASRLKEGLVECAGTEKVTIPTSQNVLLCANAEVYRTSTSTLS